MVSRTGPSRFAVIAVLMLSGNALAQLPPVELPNPSPNIPPLPSIPQGPVGQPGPIGPPVTKPLPLDTGSVLPAPAPPQAIFPPPDPRRFSFKILPNTPTKTLLPAAPKSVASTGPLLTDDLAKVPEAQFQARPEKITPNAKLVEQTAMQLAKINHLNATKTDAFMTTLLENRPDLAGLPFKMGDDCRTSGEHTKHFTHAVILVRQTLERSSAQPIVNGGFTPRPQPAAVSSAFWQSHPAACDREDELRSSADKALCEHVTVARIAALMQMLADKSPELRLGLVKHLAATSHVDATKALARMAIFSAEDEVRIAAVDALKVRREKDYTDILVKGLRYPFPAVAKRSADAIARIGRTDLIPELVGVLEEADPRMPKEKKLFGGTKINVVREMVKVNHNRNCMMCHAPGNPSTVTTAALTVEVPIEGVPLPLPAEGYRQSSPDLMIRLDVTYLRQDFSVQLAVADSNPWPEMQRFDFLVRERLVTSTEAELYREKLTPKEAGVLSPYHRAALAALRDITGKDTAPTAAAWRKLLDQPAKTVEVKRYSNGKIEE